MELIKLEETMTATTKVNETAHQQPYLIQGLWPLARMFCTDHPFSCIGKRMQHSSWISPCCCWLRCGFLCCSCLALRKWSCCGGQQLLETWFSVYWHFVRINLSTAAILANVIGWILVQAGCTIWFQVHWLYTASALSSVCISDKPSSSLFNLYIAMKYSMYNTSILQIHTKSLLPKFFLHCV